MKRFSCRNCPATFTQRHSLMSHILSVHEKDNDAISDKKCLFCSKRFFLRNDFNRHLRTHLNERPYFCTQCPYESNTHGCLKNHLLRHQSNRERPFQCQLCDKRFFTKVESNSHEKTHDIVRSLKCSACSRLFESEERLTIHKQLHSKVKLHQCQICSRRFMYEESLRKHNLGHIGKAIRFQCDHCPQSFNVKHSLKRHISCVHDDDNASIRKCPFCQKRFTVYAQLETHLRRHTMERPYFCNKCCHESGAKKDLKTHLQTHQKEQRSRPFHCQFCNKDFVTFCHRQQHLQIHTGELPFKCEVCGKGFRTNVMLKGHRRAVHSTGEKSLSCHICEELFSTKYELRVHVDLHRSKILSGR